MLHTKMKGGRMHTETYTTRKGRTLFRPVLSEEEIGAAVMGSNDDGFCLACGAFGQQVEPDARRYTCDCCGEPKVFGIPELLIMGIVQ
jgi:hypothetical protein